MHFTGQFDMHHFTPLFTSLIYIPTNPHLALPPARTGLALAGWPTLSSASCYSSSCPLSVLLWPMSGQIQATNLPGLSL